MLSRWPDYNQGENDNQNVVVLPEQLFIHQGTISYVPEEPPQQDEGIIHQWASTHDLKKKNGEWWKGKCKVITGNNEESCKIIQAYHKLPAYGHPGINHKQRIWYQDTTGGPDLVKMCRTMLKDVPCYVPVGTMGVRCVQVNCSCWEQV